MPLPQTAHGFELIPPKPGPDGRQGRSAIKIQCFTCGVEDTITTSVAQSQVPEFAPRRFTSKGWTIGKTRDADRCPTCTGRAVNPKKNHSSEDTVSPPKLTVVETPMTQLIQEILAPPVPAMSREDKRIIFDKLDSVYIDGEKGYRPDWSDERVSTDLGCHKQWVTEVRLEMFGAAEVVPLPPSALEIEVQHLRDELAQMRELVTEQAKVGRTYMEDARKAMKNAAAFVERAVSKDELKDINERVGVKPETFNQVIADLRSQIAGIAGTQNDEIIEVRTQLNVLVDAIHSITRQQRAVRRRAAITKKA